MKKTIITFLILAASVSVLPNTALAVWWNPFTWSIFVTQKPQNNPAASSTVVIAATSSVVAPTVISTTTQNSPSPEKSPVPSKKITPLLVAPITKPTTLGVSLQDQQIISTTVIEFVSAVHNKNPDRATSLVSDQSKTYFDSILNLAKSATKKRFALSGFFYGHVCCYGKTYGSIINFGNTG